MKFIELSNAKYKLYDSVHVECDGIININPFLVESVIERYNWGSKVPFVARIELSSGKYYDIVFSSTFERVKFIKQIKNKITECYIEVYGSSINEVDDNGNK